MKFEFLNDFRGADAVRRKHIYVAADLGFQPI